MVTWKWDGLRDIDDELNFKLKKNKTTRKNVLISIGFVKLSSACGVNMTNFPWKNTRYLVLTPHGKPLEPNCHAKCLVSVVAQVHWIKKKQGNMNWIGWSPTTIIIYHTYERQPYSNNMHSTVRTHGEKK